MHAPDRDRQLRRLLRFLSPGPCRVEQSAEAARVVLVKASGERCAVCAGALAAAAARGLVTRRGHSAVSLGPAGSHAARGDRAQATSTSPAVNDSESPLTLLARRRDRRGRPFLESGEIEAGERLRQDYTRGRLMPRLSANWEATVSRGRRDGGRGGMAELTEAALAARQRVDCAITAVGPELAGVLVDVCCFLKGLETVEAERQWPVRSAKIVLKTALAALARHYGFGPRGGPAESRRPIVHWGGDGYRPSIGADRV